jgi:hypothetical protein
VFAHTKLVAPDDRAAVIKRIIATLASHFGVVPAQVLLVEQEDVPKALLGKIQRTNILKRFLKGDFKKQVFEADMLLGNARTLPNWFARTRWARENLGEARGEDLAAALTPRRVVLVGPIGAWRGPRPAASSRRSGRPACSSGVCGAVLCTVRRAGRRR